MSERAVEIEYSGAVAWIWMNRPAVHNAFDENLIESLGNAFVDLDAKDTVRVIVLSGRGRSFSAGADLEWMRDAIDHYKDAAEKGGIQTKADSFNYPPDLQTLVDGVDVQTKKVKFLRSIPTDPMTGNTDWGFRSMQDDADASGWGGQNVFDVHTKSTGTALDGTKYNTW